MAAVIALATAIGIALLREFTARGFHASADLEARSKRPNLAIVPETRLKKGARPGALITNPYYGEAIRALWINLRERLGRSSTGQIVLVTSSIPEEGKSTTALTLALTAKTSSPKTLLIDCDMRRPKLAEQMGLGTTTGLGHYLSGTADLDDILYKDKSSGLYFIPAGTPAKHPLELLTSDRMEALIGALHRQFKLIILDTPPLTTVTDATVLAPLADQCLYTVRWEKTHQATVLRGLSTLAKKTGKDNINTILTRVNLKTQTYYHNSDITTVDFRKYAYHPTTKESEKQAA